MLRNVPDTQQELSKYPSQWWWLSHSPDMQFLSYISQEYRGCCWTSPSRCPRGIPLLLDVTELLLPALQPASPQRPHLSKRHHHKPTPSGCESRSPFHPPFHPSSLFPITLSSMYFESHHFSHATRQSQPASLLAWAATKDSRYSLPLALLSSSATLVPSPPKCQGESLKCKTGDVTSLLKTFQWLPTTFRTYLNLLPHPKDPGDGLLPVFSLLLEVLTDLSLKTWSSSSSSSTFLFTLRQPYWLPLLFLEHPELAKHIFPSVLLALPVILCEGLLPYIAIWLSSSLLCSNIRLFLIILPKKEPLQMFYFYSWHCH